MKTIIHFYSFDVSKPEDKEQYAALSDKLKAQGLTLFDSISPGHWDFYHKQIKPLNGQEIELETKHLFNNQWNTAPTTTSESGLRVFDWAEDILVSNGKMNKKIKIGMWLEQTPEMIAIRRDTCKCSYCGEQYYKPTNEFCTACIGGEYLTEDNLPLLFLIPVEKSDHKYNWKSVNVPASLVAEFTQRHQQTMRNKLEKRQVDKLESIEKDIENSKKEYDAFKWLIAQNIDFDNCIYYSHTGTFAFGWRDSLNDEQRADLRVKLAQFPYAWEFSKK